MRRARDDTPFDPPLRLPIGEASGVHAFAEVVSAGTSVQNRPGQCERLPRARPRNLEGIHAMTNVGLVLVTGAGGFVGSAVVRALLAAGYPVRALLRTTSPRANLAALPVDIVEGDMRDAESVARAMSGVRYVMHVAADYRLWSSDREEIRHNNVTGTRTVMEAALRAGVDARRLHEQCRRAGAARGRTGGRRVDGAHRGPGDRRVQAQQGGGPAPGRIDDRARRAAGRHRQSFDADRTARHPAHADGTHHRRGRLRPHAGLCRHRAQPRPCRRRRGGSRGRVERGKIGERYILGGQDVLLADMLRDIALIVGRNPPRLRVPRRLLYPAAAVAEMIAGRTRREPFLTLDGLRMAKNRMFFTSAKATRDLGFVARPYGEGLRDAVDWFRGAGHLQMTALVVAALACAAWLYRVAAARILLARAERDDAEDLTPAANAAWPRVVAIVPARNEAELIAASVGSLLRQDYPGEFGIVVVDDHSTDGTATVARDAAAAAMATQRLTVVPAPALPDGWTGKLWAMHTGAGHAEALPDPPDYLLFTDADIGYAPDTLTALVLRAQRKRSRVDVADGEAALRELRRARADSGVRLLLPDALSILPGSIARNRRLPRRPAAACWLRRRALQAARWNRRRPGRIDRRLRARASAEKAGPDLAGVDRPRAQPARVSHIRRHSSDDQPLRLRATALLAVAAGRHGSGHRGGVSRAAARRRMRVRHGPVACRGRLGADGAGPATHACASMAFRAGGA